MTYKGGCHCGSIAVELTLSRPKDEVAVRACDCSFCRTHGARTLTDAEGRVEIRTVRPEHVVNYRFGLKTADFLVCGNCGAFVAATIDTPEGKKSTLNVNVLDDRALFDLNPGPVSYESETTEERIARRRERWTPTAIFS